MKKKAAGLPSRVATKVGTYCDQADAAFVEGRFLEAAERYIAAWKLLPQPREQWESGREIVKCWGEAYLAAGDVDTARKAFEEAKKYKGADEDEALAAALKRVSAGAGRSPARAPKKKTTTKKKSPSRRPNRIARAPASASRPKKKRLAKK